MWGPISQQSRGPNITQPTNGNLNLPLPTLLQDSATCMSMTRWQSFNIPGWDSWYLPWVGGPSLTSTPGCSTLHLTWFSMSKYPCDQSCVPLLPLRTSVSHYLLNNCFHVKTMLNTSLKKPISLSSHDNLIRFHR